MESSYGVLEYRRHKRISECNLQESMEVKKKLIQRGLQKTEKKFMEISGKHRRKMRTID